MSLEDMIQRLETAHSELNFFLDDDHPEEIPDYDDVVSGCEIEVSDAEQAILDFVIEHAFELIAWERQHALRTSPFDEDGAR